MISGSLAPTSWKDDTAGMADFSSKVFWCFGACSQTVEMFWDGTIRRLASRFCDTVWQRLP